MPAAELTALLDLDSCLSEDERLIQKTVRDFVTARIKPQIADWFEQGIAPRELAGELGAMGLFGIGSAANYVVTLGEG
jgi:glutaryl-CoA dehydrogenase